MNVVFFISFGARGTGFVPFCNKHTMEDKSKLDKFYPHYPAGEDITRPENNNGKVPVDRGDDQKTKGVTDEADEEVAIVQGTEADVTADDIRTLEATDQNMDTVDSTNLLHASLDNVDADGDPLNEDSSADDMTGEDLDVPGSGADDADERIGEEDEENNYYSLGGDLHEAQEENKGE